MAKRTVTIEGRHIGKERSGPTPEVAIAAREKAVLRAYGGVAEVTIPKAKRSKPAPTMSEAMTKWNEMWNVSDGTMDRTRSVIKNDIQGDFGDLPVSKVSQGDIETLLASRPSA